MLYDALGEFISRKALLIILWILIYCNQRYRN
jgi:hypothetical protein